MRVLVTAGPTREYLDAVRFLSNPSSGKMGFACAVAAARAGHRVTLVTGPVALPDPPGIRTVRVVSTDDMYRAVMKVYPRTDAVIMTAAVGDYRPAERFAGKLKKKAATMTLKLVRTRDILRALGEKKGKRILVGFALEVADGVHQAFLKYKKKNLDYVVLNAPRSFASDRMDCAVYREGRVVRRFRRASKASVAAWIVRELGSP
ncbi:MAG TPA: phosphopantothenoylcysteine decarboxylase [Planctomycetota bacterium]|nr:phosphopantothenoylcysteine decarboxylase [Planctomycetota bacterium]